MKPTTQQIGVAGEHYVVAEIHRRGGHASLLTRNMPHIDMIACDADQQRRIDIQVKTKSHPGRWAGNIRDGAPHQEPVSEEKFWVLVDLSDDAPQFYMCLAGGCKTTSTPSIRHS